MNNQSLACFKKIIFGNSPKSGLSTGQSDTSRDLTEDSEIFSEADNSYIQKYVQAKSSVNP